MDAKPNLAAFHIKIKHWLKVDGIFQSCIFDLRPLENAHFKAKNAKCVITSAHICKGMNMLLRMVYDFTES